MLTLAQKQTALVSTVLHMSRQAVRLNTAKDIVSILTLPRLDTFFQNRAECQILKS